jgi:hypothetical protein
MLPGGSLATIFGPIIGTGPGRGMALVFLFCGGLIVLLGLAGLLHPRIRDVETDLPDVLIRAAAAGAFGEALPEGVGVS